MKWVEGRVVGKNEWAPGLFSLFVEASILPFQAGQYTQINIDITHSKLCRPYSLVNAPYETPLEFYFTLITGGKFSSNLAKLSVGELMWIAEKPKGRLLLCELHSAHTLWLFATGTGVGPFLSLLKTQEPWSRFKDIVLVHSVRYGNELTHQVWIETWQQRYPLQFHWVPIVTREKAMLSTFYERCPGLLMKGQLEAYVDLPLSARTSQVMLCGNPAMIKEVTSLLVQRGLQLNSLHHPGEIIVENYWK